MDTLYVSMFPMARSGTNTLCAGSQNDRRIFGSSFHITSVSKYLIMRVYLFPHLPITLLSCPDLLLSPVRHTDWENPSPYLWRSTDLTSSSIIINHWMRRFL